MCHDRPHRRLLRGFTLVELLVVIGIIAVLIAILLPALNKARQASQAVVCLSNQRQIYMLLQIYALENRDKLPIGRDSSGGWPAVLKKYTPGKQVDLIGAGIQTVPAIVLCPSQDAHTARAFLVATDYMVNHWVLGEDVTASPFNYPSARMSRLRNSTKFMILTDGTPPYAGTSTTYFALYLHDLKVLTKIGAIHPGKSANMLFADGHAEPMRVPGDMDQVHNTYSSNSGYYELR